MACSRTHMEVSIMGDISEITKRSAKPIQMGHDMMVAGALSARPSF